MESKVLPWFPLHNSIPHHSNTTQNLFISFDQLFYISILLFKCATYNFDFYRFEFYFFCSYFPNFPIRILDMLIYCLGWRFSLSLYNTAQLRRSVRFFICGNNSSTRLVEHSFQVMIISYCTLVLPFSSFPHISKKFSTTTYMYAYIYVVSAIRDVEGGGERMEKQRDLRSVVCRHTRCTWDRI